jgi:glycine hydroxymethyltransferase
MGTAEMEELGAIITMVLKNSSPAPDGKDPSKPSKVKYTVKPEAKAEALDRVAKLLDRFPVYPQLDLEFLKGAFTE